MGRILVVDDDEQVRYMLKMALDRAGYRVEVAGDGNEAIRLQEKQRFDLIIMDIVMPEKEGIETIIELRRDYPESKIIAISGEKLLNSQLYLKAADRFGAERTFLKPIDRYELLGAVDELIGKGSRSPGNGSERVNSKKGQA